MSDRYTQTNAKNESGQPPRSPARGEGFLLTFRKPLIMLAHIAAFAASLMFSFLVANNMQLRREWMVQQYPFTLLLFLIVKLPVFGLFKQYRGWWRYVSISDLVGILRASLVSTLIIVALWFGVILQVPALRRSLPPALLTIGHGVFMADLFGTILLPAGLRLVIRLYHEEFRIPESRRLKRFLIVGAGNAGEALIREILRMPVVQYETIGFIDDDPVKQGTNIHGVPVLGTVAQLPKICADRNIEEIAIAMPSAARQQLRQVVQVCEGTKIRFRTVPSITDIASGKLRVSQIRDVDINDLLGREVVHLDLDLIRTFARNKTILVTGAGGSIGSEMCRQIGQFEPKLLLLVEQAENPGEAIKNNVLGTQMVADAADRYGATNFVMISTDKAVNPTSIMGSSKRIAEMYIQDLGRTSRTQFVTVRFGNVLGSEGSVVPIFRKQIDAGGPLTITHPQMQRYFMTIPEAGQLVLQAASMGKGGEIFVLDMGEPVRIVDLANMLITLSGLRPGEDIEIVFTGPRPGEKLFEELRIEGEDMQATGHAKIRIWRNIPMDRDRLRAGIAELIESAGRPDPLRLAAKIKDLVPEYGMNNHNA
jgi:FlaA1/EpsC-like NDP-sugar epimerase